MAAGAPTAIGLRVNVAADVEFLFVSLLSFDHVSRFVFCFVLLGVGVC